MYDKYWYIQYIIKNYTKYLFNKNRISMPLLESTVPKSMYGRNHGDICKCEWFIKQDII